jgi:hypothetical protein
MVSAWLADRPEFTALAVFGRRLAERLRDASAPRVASRGMPPEVVTTRQEGTGVDAAFALRAPTIVQQIGDHAQTYEFHFPATGGEASLMVVSGDSARATALARSTRAVIEHHDAAADGSPPVATGDVDSAGSWSVRRTRRAGLTVDEAADTLRARGVRDALIALPGTAVALGTSASGDPWSADLSDPRGRMPVIGRIRLGSGQALVSATASEPGRGLIGVVVVSADARSAALWCATLLTLEPAEARARAKQQTAIAVTLIEAGAEGIDVIWVESDLEDRLQIGSQAQSLFKIVSF